MTFDANVMTNKDHCHPKSKPSWFCNSWLFQLFSPFKFSCMLWRSCADTIVQTRNLDVFLPLSTLKIFDIAKRTDSSFASFLQPLRLYSARKVSKTSAKEVTETLVVLQMIDGTVCCWWCKSNGKRLPHYSPSALQCQLGNHANGSNLSKSRTADQTRQDFCEVGEYGREKMFLWTNWPLSLVACETTGSVWLSLRFFSQTWAVGNLFWKDLWIRCWSDGRNEGCEIHCSCWKASKKKTDLIKSETKQNKTATCCLISSPVISTFARMSGLWFSSLFQLCSWPSFALSARDFVDLSPLRCVRGA